MPSRSTSRRSRASRASLRRISSGHSARHSARRRIGIFSGVAWSIEWYRTARGEAPAQTFLATLDGPLAEEAVALLAYVRVRGQALREPRSKSLGDGLFELRGRHGVRLFYTFRSGHRIVVLDGIVKKRQDIPANVLARVRAYQQTV